MSTSHYLRNLTGNVAHDTRIMRTMGSRDAGYNPSGHRYLVLQDIGAQYGDGVILSATVKYVSYRDLVKSLDAYIAGYHSAQKKRAPMMLAIGTNNDGNVSRSSGRAWANRVVDRVRAFAAEYRAVRVAGADDIEPGFTAGAPASRAWLRGYLSATRAKFIFNGSADGCPTGAGWRCNNGWSVRDLHFLSGGAAPAQIISLPQIYNTAMPLQWRVISAVGRQKVHFGGPLTEYTACRQVRSCSSTSNVSAWSMLFHALAQRPRTAQRAMPYGTDLRIN